VVDFLSTKTRCDRMAKDNRAPSSSRFHTEHLPALLEAMGLETYSFLELSLKVQLLTENFWREPRISSHNKRLRQYLAVLRKEQKLRRELAPVHRPIAEAGFLRMNPSWDKYEFAMMVADMGRGDSLDDLDQTIEGLIQGIQLLLNESNYRRRLVTKGVLEPFLDIMDHFKVVPSKKLPRRRMFEALYNVVGLDRTDRLSDVSVRNAVRRHKRKTPISV
jgi:hypothetical protein